jgi:protein subunit release factor A
MVAPSQTPAHTVRLVLQRQEGGLDALLATHDLVQMYTRYALRCGWTFALSDAAIPAPGQMTHAICQLSGLDVARRLQYEQGIHRIQHLGVQSLRQRIHTSTVLVWFEQPMNIAHEGGTAASIVGAPDRESSGLQKIRTYNYVQNRVTDHRIGRDFPGLPLLLDGDLGSLIDALDDFYRDNGMRTPEIPV